MVCLAVRFAASAAVILIPALATGQQLQLRAARAGPDLTPQSLCSPGTIASSRSGSTLIFHCQPATPAGTRSASSSTRPVPAADIRGECKEKNGSPVDCFWKCVKDKKSDCGGFITQCVDKGGEVIGNVAEASCSGVGKQSSAARTPSIAAGLSGGARPRGLAPETWCRPDTIEQFRTDGRPHIECDARTSGGRATSTAEPQVPVAKLKGVCDLVNGKVKCSIWFCTADSESNCSAFISNCAGKGGTVDGTKDDATCLLP